MNVKIFHTSSKLATQKAYQLAESIRKRKRTIFLRSPDGKLTGEKLHFSVVQVDPNSDENTSQVLLQWEVENKFEG